jgi:DNA-binding NarL/FixJ family response regulator
MNSVDSLPETTVTANTNPAPASGPVQVWLVDDNDDLRGLIAESLERHGGIVCKRQFGSPDAVMSTLASRIGPDVILLDVQMGAQNGLEAIPTIKSLSPSTRVLMLTSFYNDDWHRQAIDSGASGFLLKTDPLERLAGSICARGDAGDANLMRAVPSRIKVHRRRAACAEETGAKSQISNSRPVRKTSGLAGWFKRFGGN